MDNIFDTVHNFQKLAWKFTEKHEEEIGAALLGSWDKVMDNRHQQISVLKAEKKELTNKLNGSGWKGFNGLWQFIGAKIAKSGNFANKVSHITSLKEIDKNIRRLEWLIRKREKLHNAKFENEVNGATTPTPPPTP